MSAPALFAGAALALAAAARSAPTPVPSPRDPVTGVAALAHRAQPAVRPARPAAITTPLRDDDLAWTAPLVAIQGHDQRRSATQMSASTAALRTHASEEHRAPSASAPER